MHRRLDRLASLFDPARNGPRLAGFVIGAAVPLLLAGVVAAAFGGGMSDSMGAGSQSYIIE